jgi:hypothetical protein
MIIFLSFFLSSFLCLLSSSYIFSSSSFISPFFFFFFFSLLFLLLSSFFFFFLFFFFFFFFFVVSRGAGLTVRSYEALRLLWGLPLAEQKRVLQNSALEAQMFRLLHVPTRVGCSAAKHVIERSQILSFRLCMYVYVYICVCV